MAGHFFRRKVSVIAIFILLAFGGFLIYKNMTMPEVPENFEVQQFETKETELLIGVISDTHIPDREKFLPEEIKEKFKDVDLIIHAGDLTNLKTLEELKKIAPVIAVEGNMDLPEVRNKLPEGILLKIFDWKIGIIHSPTSFWLISHLDFWAKLAERLAKKEDFNILIFGHTHSSCLKKFDFRGKKILLLNPGSPTAPFLLEPSLAILKITKDSFQGEIIPLKKIK